MTENQQRRYCNHGQGRYETFPHDGHNRYRKYEIKALLYREKGMDLDAPHDDGMLNEVAVEHPQSIHNRDGKEHLDFHYRNNHSNHSCNENVIGEKVVAVGFDTGTDGGGSFGCGIGTERHLQTVPFGGIAETEKDREWP